MRHLPPPHSPLRAILPFCLALLLMATMAPASTRELRYREQTGEHSLLFFWQAQSAPDKVTVTVTQHQGEEVYTSVNTSQGMTLSWRYSRQPDTDVRVERKDNLLLFSGRFEGKEVRKQEKIDARPWYQPLSFCLHCMEKRRQDKATFWTIRPDNLDVLTLQAEREGSDRLTDIDGSEIPANKVVIRLEGLLSALWSAEYWFRQGDDLFVRYRGTHGPLGVPETVITLVRP
ncbi:MAG: hypothetical protein PHI97_09795 [Desulfobulbus sp.]|nr:hypothetical protein [Desulfobulbus sp.]